MSTTLGEQTTVFTNTAFTGMLEENNSAVQKIEEFKRAPITTKARNLSFVAMLVVALFFMSLFALQIIHGVVALVTSVFLLGLLVYGVKFVKKMDPLIQQKTKNFVLKKMFEEARANAVAQLDNHVLTNAKKLAQARTARNKMGALVETLYDSINTSDGSSANMLAKKKEIYKRVRSAYETVVANIENATRKHEEFERKVQDYKDLEKFTAMAGEAMSLFESSANTKLNDMLSLASFEHIDTEFNTAIIAIENTAMDMRSDNE